MDILNTHDDIIKWKHFPCNWPFVRGIHRSPVNSQHKGQWRGALVFSLICVWINDWVNNREAGDLRRYCAHYDIIVMVNKSSMCTGRQSDTAFHWRNYCKLCNIHGINPLNYCLCDGSSFITRIFYVNFFLKCLVSFQFNPFSEMPCFISI